MRGLREVESRTRRVLREHNDLITENILLEKRYVNNCAAYRLVSRNLN